MAQSGLGQLASWRTQQKENPALEGAAPETNKLPRSPDRDRDTRGYRGPALELPIQMLPDWGVAGVAQAIAAHDLGQLQLSSALCDQLYRNPRIASAIDTRVMGLTALRREFIPPDGSNRAVEIAKVAEKEWLRFVPPREQERLHKWLLFMGVGLGQNLWRRTTTAWTPHLNSWDLTNLYWNWDLNRHFGKWQLVTTGPVIEPVPGDGQWVFARATEKRPWLDGLIRSLALLYVAWNQEFRAWARYCEKYGMAFVKAIAPAEADPGLITQMEDQIANLGAEPQVTLRQGLEGNKWDVEFLEAKSTGYATFKAFIERCDADIAIAILGQNLTQEMRGFGARAAVQSHENIQYLRLCADASVIADIFYDQILRPWALFNYGDPDMAPRLRFRTDEPETLEKNAGVVSQLLIALAQMKKAGGASEIDMPALLGMFGFPLVRTPSNVARPAGPEDTVKNEDD